MRVGLWLGAAAIAVLAYLMASSTALQGALGIAAVSLVRPVVIPLVELINVPAFVYCAAMLILLAGFVACVVHHVAGLRPSLAELRGVRLAIGDLPQPRLAGVATTEAWVEARNALGQLLQRHGTFVASWSAFQAESLRGRGVPSRPFSSFVAAEPSDVREPGGSIRSLPGYFTSIGLILTFVGLVVALYFAAKGFRSGDTVQAKAAIVQLLNAASFKFLTSVSALISALIVDLYGRYSVAAFRRERGRTLAGIEIYLSSWRERIGVGNVSTNSAPADLIRRFDMLLAGVAELTREVHRLVERGGTVSAQET